MIFLVSLTLPSPKKLLHHKQPEDGDTIRQKSLTWTQKLHVFSLI